MASPRSLRNLSGKWTMNRTASSDMSPVLAMQGVNLFVRKAAVTAPIYWNALQPANGDTLTIEQTTVASLPASTEEWTHDWEDREYKMGFIGTIKRRSRWVNVGQLLMQVEAEGKGEGKGEGYAFLTEGLDPSDEVLEEEMRSEASGWVARYVWRMEGETLVRRLVIRKGKERIEARLIYDAQA